MRCAVTLSNLISRATGADFPIYQYGTDRLATSIRVLPAGEYTITANAPAGVTCYIEITDSSGANKTTIPSTGEITLPYTLTLSGVRKVSMYFGYAGFRDEPYGTWTRIGAGDVWNVHAAKSGGATTDTYGTVIIRPDEIGDGGTIAEQLCSKSTVSLTIYPTFEAWRFARRGETIVRVIDLDGGMIFKGRVSKISDRMSASGLQSQVLICVSAADFLEDTGYTDGITMRFLGSWLGDVFADHNSTVELARRLTFTLGGAAGSSKVFSGGDYIVKSHYGAITDVLTGGKYLSKGAGAFVKGYKVEWRERFQNDAAYIDIAETLGTDSDTAILIGDNLKEINIERGLDGGLYTSVMAVSGVCADGYRMAYVAYNDDMLTQYGDGRQLVVVNNDIYFTGEGGRDPRADGGYDWYSTPATVAAEAALKAFAEAEAAKLSDPPIKIALSAADLAKLGYSGYEPFEVGNAYPVVYPPGGLFGRRMRLTGLTRRLSDGQITSMTVECGEKPEGALSGSLSRQMATLTLINNSSGNEAKAGEIAATKAEEQTGGYKIIHMTKAEYDALTTYDDRTMYIVDNDGVTEVYIGAQRITSQGGGGGTIENAIVLTSEQMRTWAPDHALLPVAFRGETTAYYTGVPAWFVLQGHRCRSVPLNLDNVTPDDVMAEIELSFRTGEKHKLQVYIYNVDGANVQLGITEYDTAVNPPVKIQSLYHRGYWTLPSGASGAIKVGFSISNVNFYINSNGQVSSRYWINMWCFVGNTLATPVTSGTNPREIFSNFALFTNHENVDFLNDAERNFAYGLATRTEPVMPS